MSFPTSPSVGQQATVGGRQFVWQGSAWDFATIVAANPTVLVLVVAGGGGGGLGVGSGSPQYRGGAGGAGGFLEVAFPVELGIAYTVTVGAGGAANGGAWAQGANGGYSAFADRHSYGGGGGGGNAGIYQGNLAEIWSSSLGIAGGSGGGAGVSTLLSADPTPAGGEGLLGQGHAGGRGFYSPTGPVFNVGGGGGAGGAGGNASSGVNGAAGAGKASTLNGVTYSVGGGAFSGAGGANTGKGGGSTVFSSANAGGSGIVILRYSAALTATLSIGLTSSLASVDGDSVLTITAGTGTVVFD
jgi:hypothetical protein